MKQIQTWLLLAALALLLLPTSLLAAEHKAESSSIEVGAAGMAVDDEVNRVNEYTVVRDDDGVNPYAKARIEGGENGVYFDLDARRMSQRDQEYNLEADFNRIFRFDLDYDTFKHWLPHDQLDYMRATMKTEGQTKPGSANPAIYSEDLVPDEDFFIIHRQFETGGEVQLPSMPNVTLRAGFRQEEREGVEQVFGISHCSACHVTGDAKNIDELTTDLTVGATGKFGLLTVDYEYLTRDFEENAGDVNREYLLAAKPVDGLPTADFATGRLLFEQQNGQLPYENTPESEKDSHSLKARVDLSNNTVISGGYINTDIESSKKDT
ncbi:MAG TPA: MtrB/PioB family outer membrane beta-barrel protein, partial [Desulfuromonadales bacterium]|nr:MtrB/PioB family outer membrane beta-barrel protein [Desulfuromonadales bacterium]